MDKLLLAEAATDERALMAAYLREAGFAVQTTGSAATLLQLLERHSPALVILDAHLPDLNGPELVLRLRTGAPHSGILLLGRTDGDFDPVASLENGADGYMTKPLKLRVLLAQVRSLLRQRRMLLEQAPRRLRLAGYRVDLLRRRIETAEGMAVALTSGEFALLIGLLEQRGRAVSRQELLACLRQGQEDGGGELRTVDTLIARLRRKLEANSNRPRLIETAYGKGYRLVEEHELALDADA